MLLFTNLVDLDWFKFETHLSGFFFGRAHVHRLNGEERILCWFIHIDIPTNQPWCNNLSTQLERSFSIREKLNLVSIN